MACGSAKIQELAPDFTAKAVVDGDFQDITLSDYKGSYVVLFFYPLDFTFVCPTEIIAFNERLAEFEKIDCVVLACSTDSHFSHHAWTNIPRKKGGLGSMQMPIIADKTMEISRKYGILKEDEGIAYRGLFIIDKSGILRQITINDLPVGRSVDETIRLVKAFQFTDEYGEGLQEDQAYYEICGKPKQHLIFPSHGLDGSDSSDSDLESVFPAKQFASPFDEPSSTGPAPSNFYPTLQSRIQIPFETKLQKSKRAWDSSAEAQPISDTTQSFDKEPVVQKYLPTEDLSRRPSTRSDQNTSRRPSTRSDQNTSRRPSTRPDQNTSRRPSTRPDERSTRRESTRPDQNTSRRPSTRSDQNTSRRPSTRPDERSTRRPSTRPDEHSTRRPSTRSDEPSTRSPSTRSDEPSTRRESDYSDSSLKEESLNPYSKISSQEHESKSSKIAPQQQLSTHSKVSNRSTFSDKSRVSGKSEKMMTSEVSDMNSEREFEEVSENMGPPQYDDVRLSNKYQDHRKNSCKSQKSKCDFCKPQKSKCGSCKSQKSKCDSCKPQKSKCGSCKSQKSKCDPSKPQKPKCDPCKPQKPKCDPCKPQKPKCDPCKPQKPKCDPCKSQKLKCHPHKPQKSKTDLCEDTFKLQKAKCDPCSPGRDQYENQGTISRNRSHSRSRSRCDDNSSLTRVTSMDCVDEMYSRKPWRSVKRKTMSQYEDEDDNCSLSRFLQDEDEFSSNSEMFEEEEEEICEVINALVGCCDDKSESSDSCEDEIYEDSDEEICMST